MVVLRLNKKTRPGPNLKELRKLFLSKLQDFINKYFILSRLAKITEANINKFMKGKPKHIVKDIKKKLLT